MHGVNLLADPTFMCWPQGDTLAPAYYAIAGTGNAILRSGTGQADTRRRIGEFAARLTRGSGDLTFYQQIWQSGDHAVLDGFEGTIFGAGAWIYTTTTNTVRLYIDEGGGNAISYSGYPTASTWTWLSVANTLSATSAYLRVGVEMAGSSSDVAYVSGITATVSDTPPGRFIPCQSIVGSIGISFRGQPTVEDGAWLGFLARPGIIKAISAVVGTNPTTGGGLDFDFEVWDGAAWQQVFSGAQTLDINDETFYGEPNGTYQYRCIQGHHTDSEADTATEDQLMRLNIDDAALARDVFFTIRILQWIRPLEDMLLANSIEVG